MQSYHNLEAGDTQSLNYKWQDPGSNPGPLALQNKKLTTWQLPILKREVFRDINA